MTLSPTQRAYLERLADGAPVKVRETARTPVLDSLIALHLVELVGVGRASMDFAISDAGRAALAERPAD